MIEMASLLSSAHSRKRESRKGLGPCFRGDERKKNSRFESNERVLIDAD
jgi:hypothetical protein